MKAAKSLTKKQVKALRRALDRVGTNMPKVGSCATFRRKVVVCRDSKGFYVATSPHSRAKAKRAPRSRRLSPYYQDI